MKTKIIGLKQKGGARGMRISDLGEANGNQERYKGVHNKELSAAFEHVRKTVFPQWDKNDEWKVFYDPGLPPSGICLIEKKKIIVQSVYEYSEALNALLVHEICHSSAPGHGKRFLIRMLKAADRADRVGWSKVADLIREEVKNYENGRAATASEMYERIADCLMDNHNASYESVIAYMAQEYGMHPDEFEKCYKKCREVYDEAYREWQEYANNRQAFEARLLEAQGSTISENEG
jgi:hypothetical protein